MKTTVSILTSVDESSLAEAIAPGSGLVAVDFTAEWCAPCRVMKSVLESIAREYEGRVRVLQLDADSNPATLVRLGVRGLPTILLFHNGELIDRIVGATSIARIRERLARVVQ